MWCDSTCNRDCFSDCSFVCISTCSGQCIGYLQSNSLINSNRGAEKESFFKYRR
jgi:hypothetical protein